VAGAMIDAILFYCFAALALASAVVVVAQRHPIGSALSLIVTLSALSAIFGLLGSPFIAVLQLVVYAGAIMVLFLFVLMLLNVRREEERRGVGRSVRLLALALGGFFALQVASVVSRLKLAPASPELDGSARAVARVLFRAEYAYAFEATSVLILAALVGAVALAKRDK
jgi:NADH-quinone oxidoreductase subunit J